ncbi:hypothetical protein ACHAXN_005128 [Cyclotella atomus]
MFGKKTISTFGRRGMIGGFAKTNGAPPPAPSLSIDEKCKLVLTEMERCANWKHRHIESSILHNVPQVFVTADLQRELELELDRLLMEQLIQEEQRQIHSPSAEMIVRESIEEEPEDLNYCMACNSSPCEWKPSCDVDALTKRKKLLYRELTAAQKQQDCKMIRSAIARSVLNGGDNQFRPVDLIKELSIEIKEIDSSIKLCFIDEELHQTYATVSESVTVQSIHGFPTTVKRDAAIQALDFQHSRLIAKELAAETIEGILDWMLEGWFFGERDCVKDTITISDDDSPRFRERGTLLSKANRIQLSSNADALRAANAKKDNDDDLKQFETTMRYGIFYLTFMYFRALHLVRREKETWRGANDVVTMAKKAPLSAERIKMIEEERNIDFRKARMEEAMEKARRGEEKKRLRLERERLEKARISQWDNKRKQTAQRLALCLQRVYRGHIGRKVAKVHYLQQDRARSANVLMNACATAIARVWRGYCGRQDAKYLRKEMAEFLFAIRVEDAKDEEEEYLAMQRWF